MGNSYYYYSDAPKTDMNKIKENKNNNKDFRRLDNMMNNENKEKQEDINLEKTFKFLNVKEVRLGFNSAREIYQRYKSDFRKRGLRERDASHPSLYFVFEKDLGYYVDYLPNKGNSTTAKFIYGSNYGLRYAEKKFSDFVAHNDTVIITLKTKEITFYDYFIQICRNGNWTKSAHDYEKNNCNHFILKSLEILDAKLEDDDNFENNFIFSTEINSSKRDAIKEKIPFIFHRILGINY